MLLSSAIYSVLSSKVPIEESIHRILPTSGCGLILSDVLVMMENGTVVLENMPFDALLFKA